jgi:hypothetical protein
MKTTALAAAFALSAGALATTQELQWTQRIDDGIGTHNSEVAMAVNVHR